jgi:hypothetical protein
MRQAIRHETVPFVRFGGSKMLLTILLVVLVLAMFGGWGYSRGNGGAYGNPMGILGLVLLVVLVVILVRNGGI